MMKSIRSTYVSNSNQKSQIIPYSWSAVYCIIAANELCCKSVVLGSNNCLVTVPEPYYVHIEPTMTENYVT